MINALVIYFDRHNFYIFQLINYVNNGNRHLIVGADVRSEYSNTRYLHLIIGKAQKFVSGDKYDFWG